ncbi:Protein kinase C eta type [Frankliniella fusca]|uniref:Protein kinase C eta type n=1 Tax=Frankliniella fusca TaxID=407009 RepID=A0AAE1GSR9_9NEOP|nr:Protein kinase C eta type [Frankliniella fusca]
MGRNASSTNGSQERSGIRRRSEDGADEGDGEQGVGSSSEDMRRGPSPREDMMLRTRGRLGRLCLASPAKASARIGRYTMFTAEMLNPSHTHRSHEPRGGEGRGERIPTAHHRQRPAYRLT